MPRIGKALEKCNNDIVEASDLLEREEESRVELQKAVKQLSTERGSRLMNTILRNCIMIVFTRLELGSM